MKKERKRTPPAQILHTIKGIAARPRKNVNLLQAHAPQDIIHHRIQNCCLAQNPALLVFQIIAVHCQINLTQYFAKILAWINE